MFWKIGKYKPKEITPSTEQQENRIADALSALRNTIADQADANRRQERRENKGNTYISIATLVFVILTTAGIFYQASILNSSDRAMQASARATQDAAVAAQDSANVAKDSLKTLRAQLRAYISIGEGGISEDRSQLVIHVRNVGQTSARNFKAYLNYRWFLNKEDLPEDFGFPDLGNQPPSSVMTLVKDEDSAMTFFIDADKFKEAEAGNVSYFIYGHFDYTDIFDAPQVCEFCYKVMPPADRQNGRLQVWHTHNECT
jgi:hypothetical protein